jgi:hypothetical protein
MRFGMDYCDPGADYYEQQYRDRVIKQMHRRAAQFGFTLQRQDPIASGGVSLEWLTTWPFLKIQMAN